MNKTFCKFQKANRFFFWIEFLNTTLNVPFNAHGANRNREIEVTLRYLQTRLISTFISGVLLSVSGLDFSITVRCAFETVLRNSTNIQLYTIIVYLKTNMKKKTNMNG